MKKILVLFAAMFLACITNVYALDFENSHTYRYDIRGDDGGDQYFIKAAVKEKINIERIERDLTLGAFVEGNYQFDPDDFKMSKVGVLAGLKLLDWLSLTEDIYYIENKEDFIWRSNLNASFPFPFEVFDLTPSFKIFEEYRFNMNEGEGSRNDVGVGVGLPITDMINCYLGWRHADRIHSYDTDYIETKLTLSF